MIETLIYNVDVVTPQGVSHAFVTIDSNGFIERVETGNPSNELIAKATNAVDGQGRLLMPGAIDCHVHFREPGLTHKATIASESRAAVAGGVTSFIDMPNTVPQTTTAEAVEQKCSIAARDSVANYGFFIGATNDNLPQLLDVDYTKVAGVKLFMGSSTGGMLVNDRHVLDELFKAAPAIISIHAESESHIAAAREQIIAQYGDNAPVKLHSQLRSAEACIEATRQAVQLACTYSRKINIAHVSTAAELDLIASAGLIETKLISAEVSPHHLLWCDEDYDSLGARIKMNPSVKSRENRDKLRQAVIEGRVDIIATDHAPHLLSEKEDGLFKAVSGAPMVQFSLPAMLDMFEPALVARLMAENPARRFGISRRGVIAPGYYADLALVEKSADGYVVSDSDVISLCGWTPLAGHILHHRVISTWVNGNLIYDNGVINQHSHSLPIDFQR